MRGIAAGYDVTTPLMVASPVSRSRTGLPSTSVVSSSRWRTSSEGGVISTLPDSRNRICRRVPSCCSRASARSSAESNPGVGGTITLGLAGVVAARRKAGASGCEATRSGAAAVVGEGVAVAGVDSGACEVLGGAGEPEVEAAAVRAESGGPAP